MEIARFERRLFAYLIDLIIALAIGVSAGVPLFLFTGIPWFFSLLLTFLFIYTSYLIINIPFLGFSRGYTLGGLIFRVKTIKDDRSLISFRIAIIKSLYLGLIPFAIANAVYMVSVHTEKSVFDRITDTLVIDAKTADI